MRNLSLSVLMLFAFTTVSAQSDVQFRTYSGGIPFGTQAFESTGTRYPARNGVDTCEVDLTEARGLFPWQKRVNISVLMKSRIGHLTNREMVRENIDLNQMNQSLQRTGRFEHAAKDFTCQYLTQVSVIKTSTQNILEFNIETRCKSLIGWLNYNESVSCQISIDHPTQEPQYDMTVEAPMLPTLL